ncbi:MAG: hemerythrin domain-containing protein [Methylophilaceae bacterium]
MPKEAGGRSGQDAMKIAHKITPQTNLGELIDLIEETHHTFTRSELTRISGLMEDPELASLPLLDALRQCFHALKADLESHLRKEEEILFPYIASLDSGLANLPASCFGSVANPIRMMRIEHITMISLLETLRELTSQYTPLADSVPPTFLLYASLAGIDADLVEHMYWEDHVLFPRALQVESRITREKDAG